MISCDLYRCMHCFFNDFQSALDLRLKDNDKPLEIEKFFDIEKQIEETATEKNWNEMSSQFWLLRTWNLIKTIEEPISA